MEGNDSGLSAYYNPHHHHHQQLPQQQHHHHSSITTSANNGNIFSSPNSHYSTSETTPLVFPHPVPGRPSAAPVPTLTESVKRKRGRPRKYGPGGPTESSPTASKKPPPAASHSSLLISSPSSISPTSPTHKKEPPSNSSNKKAQLDALGNAGQGFTPHVITVAAGEDVAQKIMSFMQQQTRAVCILSASGSISNASLRQPAMLGGNVTYEGRFEILSLSGSYLHTEIGGASSRTGGLSVCLSGADGRIVGGGVGGLLKAAGPVQVIAGSFVLDGNKDSSPAVRAEASAPLLGATVSPVSFRPSTDPSARITARLNDEHRKIGGSRFISQSQAMQAMHRSNVNVELTGRSDGGACQSPEDGDDEDIQD